MNWLWLTLLMIAVVWLISLCVEAEQKRKKDFCQNLDEMRLTGRMRLAEYVTWRRKCDGEEDW